MNFRKLQFIFFVLIFFLAVFFRFNNLNWDENLHLHPDERFLTMVGNAIKIPPRLSTYFDQQTSTFNPANNNFPFFVYGIFPLTINKIVAVIFNNDNYNAFTTQGRALSALADLLVVYLVYKTTELMTKRFSNVPLWAAFFYAIAVLPIQLSHFFATDSFLNFFMFASFYGALKYTVGVGEKQPHSLRYMFLSALFFGLALATKATAFFILPLNLLVIVISTNKFSPATKYWKKILGLCVLYFIFAYFTVRLADPYMFQSPYLFDPRPSNLFVKNLQELKSFENPSLLYPPGVQWIHKAPILFSLYNLAAYGVGWPYFVFVVLGIIGLISKIKDQISKLHSKSQNASLITLIPLIILIWAFSFFIYQSTQYVKTIRYFIFLYPFLAIFAALGLVSFISFLKIKGISRRAIIYLLIIAILLIWPFAFSSIYVTKNSRVASSEWIYKNLPDQSTIASEYWDDALPMVVPETFGKQFTSVQLPVFDHDTPQKWEKINMLLSQSNYYILSSNRGWGSITTVPEKYPLMSKFYRDLFAGKLPYRLVKEFHSYPSLSYLGIPITFYDASAEEIFTVYDHPEVFIYKNVR